MRILYVYGDEYSALNVEQEIGIEEAAKLVEENGGQVAINNNEFYANLKILTFKEVDPEFVSFVQLNLLDYDASKSENFYVIEEAK